MLLPNIGNKKANIQCYQHLKFQILSIEHITIPKKFLLDTCPFLEPLIPLFRTSGDVSSGFQSQSGQPYSNFAEAYMIYVP